MALFSVFLLKDGLPAAGFVWLDSAVGEDGATCFSKSMT